MKLSVLSTLALGVAVVTMAACTQTMPRGYKYQDDTPLSSPQPSSPWNDKAVIHDTENMATSTAAWQGAVFDVLDKLKPALPVDGTPIILIAKPPFSAQDIAFDHYLRQGLMQKGMNLTTTTGSAYVLEFDTAPLSEGKAMERAIKEAGYQHVKGASVKGIYLLEARLKQATGAIPAAEAVITAVIPYENAGYTDLTSGPKRKGVND